MGIVPSRSGDGQLHLDHPPILFLFFFFLFLAVFAPKQRFQHETFSSSSRHQQGSLVTTKTSLFNHLSAVFQPNIEYINTNETAVNVFLAQEFSVCGGILEVSADVIARGSTQPEAVACWVSTIDTSLSWFDDVHWSAIFCRFQSNNGKYVVALGRVSHRQQAAARWVVITDSSVIWGADVRRYIFVYCCV